MSTEEEKATGDLRIDAAVSAWYDNGPTGRPRDWPSPRARMQLALEAADEIDSWRSAAETLASEEFELGESIFEALIELENGDHASAGRDFGRGIAYATKLIRERLHVHYESREKPTADSAAS